MVESGEKLAGGFTTYNCVIVIYKECSFSSGKTKKRKKNCLLHPIKIKGRDIKEKEEGEVS